MAEIGGNAGHLCMSGGLDDPFRTLPSNFHQSKMPAAASNQIWQKIVSKTLIYVL